ncbi:uncharacterized protein LAESUDRAFT_816186 [Laetiporus sulphureus 93-53]|uniref:SMP-30/Gluconolactonase/LRE-like region domain-containing protein n=1 Tax=Laetiporus sulphureus 93-53 TaxID=1314785 RepID=A0A165BGD6_9APHY|nr:uncharacterized protein LAESUDRAFT_816186 [Laetiporus sulphureus 93-53]KZT01009.1 hypothetical protein LAESUDRAFT_816186 [Laetiporus sulphureus 93-53]
MPPNLVLVHAHPPHNATVLLDNYFGQQFNSLNSDVKVHPKSGAIFFTDVTVDSGAAGGFLGRNTTLPSTIYAFDVERKSQVFLNRRVFTYVDAGIPDGLQVDTAGNIYSGCADGVHVWNKEGTLIGKFFLGAESANLVFAGKGMLVILAERVVYLAEIAADGVDLAVD